MNNLMFKVAYNEKVFPVIDIDLQLGYVVANINGQHTILQKGRFELLQYTGVVDKNGTRIFDKDILSNGEHINWIVFYDEASFKVKLTNPYVNDSWILGTSEARSREIIGNAHSNPELVESW